jgi:hypothetical protein
MCLHCKDQHTNSALRMKESGSQIVVCQNGTLCRIVDVLEEHLPLSSGPTQKIFFLVAPASEHMAEFPQFLDQGQSVGLLGRVISLSQGLYPYTNTEKRTHIHKR